MEHEIMETVLRDMLQDLEAIKQQKQHFVKLQEVFETQNEAVLRIEQKVSNLETLPVRLSDNQVTSLKNIVKQEFEMLQMELRNQPTTHKSYYSIFPVSFRMEFFRMVVNTIMTWVVVLIALFFVIWLVVRYVS